MTKIRNQLLNDEVRSRQSSLARSQAIAEHALYDGDPDLVNTEIERLLAITDSQIADAAAKYLDTEDRALLDIVPAAAE